MGRLEGQTALVTGASSGIGAAAAQLLAREGAEVFGLARSEPGLRAAGVRRPLVVDVTDRPALERAVPDGLDIAVVAAAAGAFGRFGEIPPEDFDRCVAVTFGGAVNTIRAVLPRLRPGARLIVVGSAADVIPLPLLSPYVAAKHALDGFLKSLRTELGDDLSLCVVRPGVVDSPFWRHLAHPGDLTPPQMPPLLAYSAESVGQAVVACAIEPRASVTVGGSTSVLEAANAVAGPLVQRVLRLAGRLARKAATPDPAPNALWEPSGDGSTGGGLRGRPSAVVAVRWRRVRRP